MIAASTSRSSTSISLCKNAASSLTGSLALLTGAAPTGRTTISTVTKTAAQPLDSPNKSRPQRIVNGTALRVRMVVDEDGVRHVFGVAQVQHVGAGVAEVRDDIGALDLQDMRIPEAGVVIDPVDALILKARQVQHGLAHGLAGDGAGVDAPAADHVFPRDQGDAFSVLGPVDGSPLPRGSRADRSNKRIQTFTLGGKPPRRVTSRSTKA